MRKMVVKLRDGAIILGDYFSDADYKKNQNHF